MEAESIAYTVCQHFGIDTSEYSFGYIAGWSSGRDMKELKSSLDTIRRTASELITGIASLVSTILAAIYAADTVLSVQSALYLQKKTKMNSL